MDDKQFQDSVAAAQAEISARIAKIKERIEARQEERAAREAGTNKENDASTYTFAVASEETTEGTEANEIYFGSAEADVYSGMAGNDRLFGRDGNDYLYGNDGNDRMKGGRGDDTLDGGSGNDMLKGGSGNDVIWMGEGNDKAHGGSGDDVIMSLSWGGEPIPAQDADALVNEGEPLEDYDVMTGGDGADTFTIRWLIDATDEVIAANTDENGDIDYTMNGVAGANDNVHDHWVETTGTDVITDFDADEGDQLIFEGHTVQLDTLELYDWNGDGDVDTVLHFISNPGNAAHGGDEVGTVVVLSNELTEDDIVVDAGVFYGVEEPLSALG